MEELFGVPMNIIALVLLAMLAVVIGSLVGLAWRNRIMLKLGVRNIPRRRAQTLLIILGLMLSTLIIASALGTGDTMVYTVRALAARDMGHTDEIISTATPEDDIQGSRYFEYSQFGMLLEELSAYDRVDGIAPAITGVVPLVNMTTRQSEPRTLLFAPDPSYLSGFGRMTTEAGETASLDSLDVNEVYLDTEAAEGLRAAPTDDLRIFLGGKPVSVKMKAVVKDTSAGTSPALIMPLSRAQQLLGLESQISTIYISNKGDQVQGAEYTDEVQGKLESLLEDTGLEVSTVKKDVLEIANRAGSAFTTIFVAFGLFSIAAGLLLIFLIFTLLAAARKPEMGMARAVGTKRHHLVQMFLFEGIAYDLGAAIVGVILGIAVTYGIAGIMARTFARTPLDFAYHLEPRSMAAAFAVGVLVTFFTVAFSSWRVSRLNIVTAIRDIPEPYVAKVGRRWLFFAIVLFIIGSVSVLTSFPFKQASPLYLGVSLIIIGLALLLRWFGLGARLTFSFAGIALLVWSLLPVGILEPFLGEMKLGIEMFFFSGVMMVLGAVWLVVYNLNLLFDGLTTVFGRLRRTAPALKTAIAHAADNRTRTGLTVAMFSLVIFTITFMSTVITANAPLFEDVDSFSGGYDIRGTVSYNNPIPDIHEAVANADGLDADDFEAIASQSTISSEVRQPGAATEDWTQYPVHGVDDVYIDTNGFEFATLAEGYSTAREVWQALKENPGLAVISADAVPSRSQFAVVIGRPEFRLEGVYQEDEVMSPIELEARERTTGSNVALTIVGVIRPTTFNAGVYTSQRTLSQAMPFAIIPTTYLFKLRTGVDATATAQAIESEFLVNGMEARSIKEILDEASEMNFTMNSLLQAFMSLGLVVGIAALGVISTRAVVERRHEIGVLRAIGWQRGMVQLSFLLESSIVALLGIVIGVALALSLSYNVIDFMKAELEGLEFQIPWLQTFVIAAVAYCASLLMTFFPAWRASKIYPAEALRYE